MGYLDYYKYQAKARGIHSAEDVRRNASEKAYVYDRIVLPWLPAERAEAIAEMACGHGAFLCWLKGQGFQNISGADSSAEQVALARQISAKVDEGDAIQWVKGQPAGSLSALVAIDFVEHVSKDDFMEVLAASHGALVPGGSLILRLPNGDSPFVGRNLFNDITHVWTYTPNCLESLGRMHGFSSFEFCDEGASAIRDSRWLKVPLARVAGFILRALTWACTRERIQLWSPHLWARLRK